MLKNLFYLVLILTTNSIIGFSQESKREKKEREANEKFDAEFNQWREKLYKIKLPRIDEVVTYEFVDSIQTKDKTKGDLVISFKSSLSSVLKDAKSAIDVEDKDGGLVIAKVTDIFSYKQGGNSVLHPLKYTLKFQAKEGKFRIRLTDIEVGDENLLYFGMFNRSITYFKLDQPEVSIEKTKDAYRNLNKRQKELVITIREAMNSHLKIIINGLGQMVIKNSKDSF